MSVGYALARKITRKYIAREDIAHLEKVRTLRRMGIFYFFCKQSCSPYVSVHEAQLCVRAERPSAVLPGALVASLLGARSTPTLGPVMKASRLLPVLVLAAVGGSAWASDEAWRLRFDGLGPIRIGMTVPQPRTRPVEMSSKIMCQMTIAITCAEPKA